MKTALLEQLKRYENKWVALLEPGKEIVASGKDAVEAKRAAEKKGYRNIILFRVFPFNAGYVPFV